VTRDFLSLRKQKVRSYILKRNRSVYRDDGRFIRERRSVVDQMHILRGHLRKCRLSGNNSAVVWGVRRSVGVIDMKLNVLENRLYTDEYLSLLYGGVSFGCCPRG